jgi:hypothetical protein
MPGGGALLPFHLDAVSYHREIGMEIPDALASTNSRQQFPQQRSVSRHASQ